MCETELNNISQLTEHILPSLDMNDAQTLNIILSQTSSQVGKMRVASAKHSHLLADNVAEWHQFQVKYIAFLCLCI